MSVAELDRIVASDLRKQADMINELIANFKLQKPENVVWLDWFKGEQLMLRDVAVALDRRANENDRLCALLVMALPHCKESLDLTRAINLAIKP